MAWRLAKSLETLRKQVNVEYPNRSKDSDGSIGDEAHASRSSDHNPWIKDPAGGPNVVSAIDITHDPKGGFDSYLFAEMLRHNRDDRIKYVISNRKIFSATQDAWNWRPYSGSNPHDHHVHISVREDKGHYDNIRPWTLDKMVIPPEVANPVQPLRPKLAYGSSGQDVGYLQRMLGLPDTDAFDQRTRDAVIEFQKRFGLAADGIVGPYTWRQLEA